jgi:hypothetical protein
MEKSNLINKPEDIISITWDNLNFIKPEWLNDNGIFYSIKYFSKSLLDSPVTRELIVFYEKLSFLLKSDLLNISNKRPDLFAEYLRILIIIKASLLNVLEEKEIEKLIQSNLITILEVIDFDFSEIVFNYLYFFKKDVEIFNKAKSSLLQAVKKNDQILGENNIFVGVSEQSKIPTTENWLIAFEEYASSFNLPVGAKNVVDISHISKKRSLEIVSFLQKSQNIKFLKNDDYKKILQRLFEFYEWLKNLQPDDSFISPLIEFNSVKLEGVKSEVSLSKITPNLDINAKLKILKAKAISRVSNQK